MYESLRVHVCLSTFVIYCLYDQGVLLTRACTEGLVPSRGFFACICAPYGLVCRCFFGAGPFGFLVSLSGVACRLSFGGSRWGALLGSGLGPLVGVILVSRRAQCVTM